MFAVSSRGSRTDEPRPDGVGPGVLLAEPKPPDVRTWGLFFFRSSQSSAESIPTHVEIQILSLIIIHLCRDPSMLPDLIAMFNAV